MTTPITTDEPDAGELWVLYHARTDADGDRHARLALAECIGEPDETDGQYPPIDEIRTKMIDRPYKARYLYDADHHYLVDETGSFIARHKWYYRLDESPADVDEHYHDLLDYALRQVPKGDVADILAGEGLTHPNLTGKEALRHFATDGIFQSITEFSIGQGHGPSRYAQAVESRIEGLPTWMQETALYAESNRWKSSMIDSDQAAFLVEIMQLKQQYLDDDLTDEISQLVNDFDLEYDEYRDEY